MEATRAQIPELPAEAETPCTDLMLTDYPEDDVLRHRVELARCENRRALAVGAYHEVEDRFGISERGSRVDD